MVSGYLRMVVYEDYATKCLSVLTMTHIPCLTIAHRLYQGNVGKWNVSSNGSSNILNIKAFCGTSQNAVYSQIWIAICTDLLLYKRLSNQIVISFTLSREIINCLFARINSAGFNEDIICSNVLAYGYEPPFLK